MHAKQNMKKTNILHGWLNTAAVIAVLTLTMSSCNNKKFYIEGTIGQAADSMLYLDHMSLNGPVAIDSVKLDETGHFSFSDGAPQAPEF